MNKLCQNQKNSKAETVYILVCEKCEGNVGCKYRGIDRYCDACKIVTGCLLMEKTKFQEVNGGICSRCLNDRARVSIYNPMTGLQFLDVWTKK